MISRYFNWGDDRHPRTPYHETVIYEAPRSNHRPPPDPTEHAWYVRWSRASHDDPYLTTLGVTAVELMPVHQFVIDHHLAQRGLTDRRGL